MSLKRSIKSCKSILVGNLVATVRESLAYHSTTPVSLGIPTCVWDYCGSARVPTCKTYRAPACSQFFACGYPGPGQTGNPCATNNLYEQSVDEKHYRLSRATGYNNDLYNDTGQFEAFTLTFSALDSTAGAPDKIFSFGSLDDEAASLRDEVTFTQEVIGVFGLNDYTPEYEGLFFMLEDGSIKRIGRDKDHNPVPSEFTMLTSRLVGMAAKNYVSILAAVPNGKVMGDLGFYIDSTSCEEGLFTSPNPFTNMSVDVFTGSIASQTQSVKLSTAWGDCTYTYVMSHTASWLTSSTPTTDQIQVDVQSTDMSLVGTSMTLTVTLTPDFIDTDGYPSLASYTFDVSFFSSCSVTSISFDVQTSNQSYKVTESLLTSDAYSVQQLPQACYTPVFTVSSTPDASSFVTHDSAASNFEIETQSMADSGTYTVYVTATIPQETSPGSGVSMSTTFSFTVEVIDPCESTTLTFSPVILDMVAYVDQGAETQTILATDLASSTYGNNDGSSLCGPRTYSLASSSSPVLSLVSDSLILASTDPSDASGPLIITIEAKLDNYQNIPPASQAFTIEVICRVTTISWAAALPSTYSHTLIQDPILATIPFATTQAPSCDAALSYSFTDQSGAAPPIWLQLASSTANLELSAHAQSLAGTYSFQLSASDPATGVTSPMTLIDITLVDPCEVTTVTATKIPDQVLYAQNFAHSTTMNFSVPFIEFVCEITLTHGVDCGHFNYNIAAVGASMVPDDPQIIQSLSVNTVDSMIDISLDKSLIPTGLIASFSLTGALNTFPAIQKTETFQLTVTEQVKTDSFTPQFSQNPPTLFIQGIDYSGLVTIKSNTTMDPAVAFTSTELHQTPLSRRLDNLGPFTEAGYSEHIPGNYSLIQNSTVIFDQAELPSIALNIEFFDPLVDCEDQLGFAWKFIEYSEEALYLQLEFDNPHCVSQTSNTGDKLQVTFNDQRLFRDKVGNFIEHQLVIEGSIPRQLPEEDLQVVESLSAFAYVVIGTTCALTLTTNTLFSMGLDKFVSAWKSMQLLIHVILINLYCTAASENTVQRLFQFMKVEIFDTASVLEEDVFGALESDAMNVHFEASGYETSTFILNAGPAFVLILLAPVYVLLMYLLGKCCCIQRIKTYALNKVDGLLFNGILQFLEAELILLATSASIEISQVSKRKVATANTSLYFALAIQTLVVLSFICLTGYLLKNHSRLKEDSFARRFGAVYEKYNVERSPKSAILVMACTHARNFCLAYVITFGEDFLILQLFYLSLTSEIILALIGHFRPLQTREQHLVDMGNEFCISFLLMSLLVCQTGLINDLQTKLAMGWVLIAVILIIFIANFGLVMHNNIRLIYQRAKRCVNQRRLRNLKSKVSQKSEADKIIVEHEAAQQSSKLFKSKLRRPKMAIDPQQSKTSSYQSQSNRIVESQVQNMNQLAELSKSGSEQEKMSDQVTQANAETPTIATKMNYKPRQKKWIEYRRRLADQNKPKKAAINDHLSHQEAQQAVQCQSPNDSSNVQMPYKEVTFTFNNRAAVSDFDFHDRNLTPQPTVIESKEEYLNKLMLWVEMQRVNVFIAQDDDLSHLHRQKCNSSKEARYRQNFSLLIERFIEKFQLLDASSVEEYYHEFLAYSRVCNLGPPPQPMNKMCSLKH